MDIKPSMTESEILQYVNQVKSEECVDTLQTYKKDIDYKYISKHRNKQCSNKINLGDRDIGMYSDDQIILYTEKDSGIIYCFTYEEIDFLIQKGINPYTKKKLSPEFLNNLRKLETDVRYDLPVYPLDKAVNMFKEAGTCFRTPSISDEDIAYIISFTSVDMDSLPDNIVINNYSVGGSYEHPIFISKMYKTADLGILFIYKIKLRKPIDVSKSTMKKDNILNMVKVFASDDIETVNPSDRTYNIEDDDIKKELKLFMTYFGSNLSNNVLKKLEELSIKEFFPIKVYRGMTFYDDKFIKRYKVGDTFSLYSLGRVQSWSSTHCVSEYFASRARYGIILSTTLQPEDIAIDTRLLEPSQTKSFFWREQREIMSVPFNLDKSEKRFLVKVESILTIHKNSAKNVNSLKYYSNFPDKDIDIMDYKIGAPISKEEAYINFYTKEIDFSKIPKQQRDLVVDGKFIDPITLEETTDIVQLKECGTIVSNDTIKELIDNNTTEWQGRENVGFKSPITNTIYGNLVMYNYNDEFLPQKPGYLSIEIENTTGIKDTTKGELIKKWYKLSYKNMSGLPYIFRSDGKNVVMYYPKNSSGEKIINLMCECFQKGNLFAFDSYGRVRHGRVHKKTSLLSEEFGYPDDTYEMRVTSELMDLGCTPYTASFNFEIKYNSHYPNERRWVLHFSPTIFTDEAMKAFVPFISSIPDSKVDTFDIKKYEMEREDKYRKRYLKYINRKIKEIDEASSKNEKREILGKLFEYLRKKGLTGKYGTSEKTKLKEEFKEILLSELPKFKAEIEDLYGDKIGEKLLKIYVERDDKKVTKRYKKYIDTRISFALTSHDKKYEVTLILNYIVRNKIYENSNFKDLKKRLLTSFPEFKKEIKDIPWKF